jgi:hypothetical protein
MGGPVAPRPNYRIQRVAMRLTFLLLLGLSFGGCRTLAPSGPRYIVTLTPVSLGGGQPGRDPGLCIAVDPTDAQGVWWWQPGLSGCSRRITGPTVFRAHLATVATARDSGVTEVGFQVPVMEGPPRDFRLVLDHGGMRVAASGERVSTERRRDLDIPPAHGR